MRGIAPEITRLDRKTAPRAFDDRRVTQELGNARAVDRRRHDENFQILAQALLRIAREREPEIGIEGAFMEFVEQHGGNAIERRIVEHQSREHALGDDLDASLARHLRAKAHAIADRLADLLAERRRHALGRRARGEPARLKHENFFVCRPRLVDEHQRHARGLAGAGRRDQHGDVGFPQRRRELRQRRVDRQWRAERPWPAQVAFPGRPILV